MFGFSRKGRTLVRKKSNKTQAEDSIDSMVQWLAPWTLNPKTRDQISVEPPFHCHKNSSVASCLCLFSLKNVERLSKNFNKNTSSKFIRFYGVVVSTLDFEYEDPSSNLGRTSFSLSQKHQCSFVYVCFL